EALLCPRVNDAWLAQLSATREEIELLRELDIASLMVLPLRYQQRPLGTLTLFFGRETHRHHQHADLTLGMELAQRAAGAGENARVVGQAQEAVRKRDEFLSVASHELKTPLTTLELQVSGLLRSLRLGRLGSETSPEVVHRLDRVERQAQRLNRIIEEL